MCPTRRRGGGQGQTALDLKCEPGLCSRIVAPILGPLQNESCSHHTAVINAMWLSLHLPNSVLKDRRRFGALALNKNQANLASRPIFDSRRRVDSWRCASWPRWSLAFFCCCHLRRLEQRVLLALLSHCCQPSLFRPPTISGITGQVSQQKHPAAAVAAIERGGTPLFGRYPRQKTWYLQGTVSFPNRKTCNPGGVSSFSMAGA